MAIRVPREKQLALMGATQQGDLLEIPSFILLTANNPLPSDGYNYVTTIGAENPKDLRDLPGGIWFGATYTQAGVVAAQTKQLVILDRGWYKISIKVRFAETSMGYDGAEHLGVYLSPPGNSPLTTAAGKLIGTSFSPQDHTNHSGPYLESDTEHVLNARGYSLYIQNRSTIAGQRLSWELQLQVNRML